MSAILCGKRTFFDDLSASLQSASSPAVSKRRRFSSSGPPVRFSSPVSNLPSPIDQLMALFPLMENQLLEKALEDCDNDLDAAIKRLHVLSLGYAPGNASAEEANGCAEKGTPATDRETADLVGPSVESIKQMSGGAEWVEFFVREVMSTTCSDDARCRAVKILEGLGKSISRRAGAEAAQNYYKENVMLKEQIELLLRENSLLKHAVAIQHDRQKEYEAKDQEVHHLKQLLSRYQEQLRTLEINNYVLTAHLLEARKTVLSLGASILMSFSEVRKATHTPTCICNVFYQTVNGTFGDEPFFVCSLINPHPANSSSSAAFFLWMGGLVLFAAPYLDPLPESPALAAHCSGDR